MQASYKLATGRPVERIEKTESALGSKTHEAEA